MLRSVIVKDMDERLILSVKKLSNLCKKHPKYPQRPRFLGLNVGASKHHKCAKYLNSSITARNILNIVRVVTSTVVMSNLPSLYMKSLKIKIS